MIKKNKIPTILGIVILLAGIFAGVFFLGMRQIFKIGADASVAPKDIRVSNITESSVTISWITDKETAAFLTWGDKQTSVNQVEKESATDGKFFTHSITISGLQPNTTYFYKINSDGNTFDNKNIPWEVTTGATLPANKTSSIISGSVINASGNPEKRALVYSNISGTLLSTFTSDSGTFIFQLGDARSQDLQSYAEINEASTLIEISVIAGSDGISSAKIFPQSAKPIPTIIIGQVYDFRNFKPGNEAQIPNANLNLPESATKESKFSLPLVTSSPSPTSVILESLKEGEVVTSTKPAFFGRGPGGEQITITIQSDTITQVMNITKNGTWTFTTPSNLAPGPHSITVSWVDSLGITRTLTRNFIVQAGEVPAFEASPSQSISPNASGTPTPTPTLSATSTPSPTAIASAEPVPVTGSLTGTYLLSIMGVAVMLFGFAVWKLSEN